MRTIILVFITFCCINSSNILVLEGHEVSPWYPVAIFRAEKE